MSIYAVVSLLCDGSKWDNNNSDQIVYWSDRTNNPLVLSPTMMFPDGK